METEGFNEGRSVLMKMYVMIGWSSGSKSEYCGYAVRCCALTLLAKNKYLDECDNSC
jgi:diaminopimelate epimerase